MIYYYEGIAYGLLGAISVAPIIVGCYAILKYRISLWSTVFLVAAMFSAMATWINRGEFLPDGKWISSAMLTVFFLAVVYLLESRGDEPPKNTRSKFDIDSLGSATLDELEKIIKDIG